MAETPQDASVDLRYIELKLAGKIFDQPLRKPGQKHTRWDVLKNTRMIRLLAQMQQFQESPNMTAKTAYQGWRSHYHGAENLLGKSFSRRTRWRALKPPPLMH